MRKTTKRETEIRFHEAIIEAYKRHDFMSLRHAESVTGLKYSTIHSIISRVHIPKRGSVIEWAEGLGEDINHWLELAGYDPIPEDLICKKSPTPEETMNIVTLALNEVKELDTGAKKRLLESIRTKLEGLVREKAEGKVQ